MVIVVEVRLRARRCRATRLYQVLRTIVSSQARGSSPRKEEKTQRAHAGVLHDVLRVGLVLRQPPCVIEGRVEMRQNGFLELPGAIAPPHAADR